MPPEPPTIQSPSLRIALSHLLNQIENHHTRTPSQHPVPLHWDSRSKSLGEFAWPCDPSTGARVAPRELEAYRRTHEFKGPCCLCAFLDKEDYTESHIGVIESICGADGRNGRVLNGEYVAVCARNRCGYFVCLEHFYLLQDIKVRVCKQREHPLPLQNLIPVSDVLRYYRNGGLFQVVPEGTLRGNRQDLQSLDPNEAQANEGIRLMSDLSQGMEEDQFWSTFVQCLRCKRVFLRQSFTVSDWFDCARSRSADAGARPRHPMMRPVKAVLGYALGDMPQDYPATPGLHRGRLRETSPTPTIRSGDLNSDQFDLFETQSGASPDPLDAEGAEYEARSDRHRI